MTFLAGAGVLQFQFQYKCVYYNIFIIYKLLYMTEYVEK